MYRFCFFPPHSLIALNKQHDIHCLYLIKIMKQSKMQMTTAKAMVSHLNAWFSWLKPAAAIEATISTVTDGSRPIVSFSLSFPPLSLPPLFILFFFAFTLMTKALCLEVLILFEHYVNNIKTHHSWIFYWLWTAKKLMWSLNIDCFSFCHNMQWIFFSQGFCIYYNNSQ